MAWQGSSVLAHLSIHVYASGNLGVRLRVVDTGNDAACLMFEFQPKLLRMAHKEREIQYLVSSLVVPRVP
jgi:hypothetical protein